MFQKDSSTQSTKLKERNLIHKRITDLAELQRVYEFGEVLGKGSFGTVVKANHKSSNVNWAIKIINKSQAGASRVMLVEREIYILKLVNHPNIIFLDCVFELPKTIYLVFELCTGSLAKTFKAKKRFEETETLSVIRSLAGALSYLHKNDIVHRDLKLENILIAANPQDPNDNLHIKVTDFGLSAVRGGTGYEDMLHECCGTLIYMAPEMIASKSYSQQCDVWSMGIIMYILIVGKFPFYSTNNQQLYLLVKTQELDFSSLSCSSEAKHLLNKMLQKNPAFRMTAAEVENHPWISDTRTIVHRSHSTNVLDMMRMWRSEMMEPSKDQNSAAISTSGQNTDDYSKSVSIGVIHTADESAASAAAVTSERIISKVNLRREEKFTNESPYPRHRFWEIASPPLTATSSKILQGSKVSESGKVSVSKKVQVSAAVCTATSDIRNDSANESAICETGRLSALESTIVKNRRVTNYVERRRLLPSGLPDFSHVTAKVDTNLANIRRESLQQAQRKRGHIRNHKSTVTHHSVPWENK